LLADKQKRCKFAFKDLAVAKSKRKNLLDLLDDRRLEVVQLKTGKNGAVAEVNLLKKLHKTELKSKKELSKKEILAKSVIIKSLEASKNILKQDFDKAKKLDIVQDMRVKVKQLALEETCERSSKAPKTPKKSLAMGLDNKKELATHNALLKKQQKENNDTRAALKKNLKKSRCSQTLVLQQVCCKTL
jgi:hypothetical protein